MNEIESLKKQIAEMNEVIRSLNFKIQDLQNQINLSKNQSISVRECKDYSGL